MQPFLYFRRVLNDCVMRPKEKICDHCLEKKLIWKNYQGQKYCLLCWNRIKPENLKKVPVVRKVRIRPVSQRQEEKLRVYRRKRDKFLEGKTCEFPGCTSTEVTLHHAKGRIGSFLTDKRYFKALCWPHHQWVETHPEEAKQMGLSLSRLDNEDN
jgi:hypothetical protein